MQTTSSLKNALNYSVCVFYCLFDCLTSSLIADVKVEQITPNINVFVTKNSKKENV